jgi:hypothetical protein
MDLLGNNLSSSLQRVLAIADIRTRLVYGAKK